jgi:hypothetical protein
VFAPVLPTVVATELVVPILIAPNAPPLALPESIVIAPDAPVVASPVLRFKAPEFEVDPDVLPVLMVVSAEFVEPVVVSAEPTTPVADTRSTTAPVDDWAWKRSAVWLAAP